MVVFGNGTRHSRLSPATLVPEVDQQLLGAALVGLLDPSISPDQAEQLRSDLKEIYREFMAACSRAGIETKTVEREEVMSHYDQELVRYREMKARMAGRKSEG